MINWSCSLQLMTERTSCATNTQVMTNQGAFWEVLGRVWKLKGNSKSTGDKMLNTTTLGKIENSLKVMMSTSEKWQVPEPYENIQVTLRVLNWWKNKKPPERSYAVWKHEGKWTSTGDKMLNKTALGNWKTPWKLGCQLALVKNLWTYHYPSWWK